MKSSIIILIFISLQLISCGGKIDLNLGDQSNNDKSNRCFLNKNTITWAPYSNPDLDLGGFRLYRKYDDAEDKLIIQDNDPNSNSINLKDTRLDPCNENKLYVKAYMVYTASSGSLPIGNWQAGDIKKESNPSNEICWGIDCSGISAVTTIIENDLEANPFVVSLTESDNVIQANILKHADKKNPCVTGVREVDIRWNIGTATTDTSSNFIINLGTGGDGTTGTTYNPILTVEDETQRGVQNIPMTLDLCISNFLTVTYTDSTGVQHTSIPFCVGETCPTNSKLPSAPTSNLE